MSKYTRFLNNKRHILHQSFYQRDTVIVAKDLIGKILVREYNGTLLTGIIIETEAYCADDDPASHAFNGKTKRNAAMFGPVGCAYVYFIYGNHYCLNIVARDECKEAGAVLIRALQPLQGIEIMQVLRTKPEMRLLANGPGKLTQALALTKDHDGVNLMQKGALYVVDNHVRPVITATPRIGIRVGTDKLWRFCGQSS